MIARASVAIGLLTFGISGCGPRLDTPAHRYAHSLAAQIPLGSSFAAQQARFKHLQRATKLFHGSGAYQPDRFEFFILDSGNRTGWNPDYLWEIDVNSDGGGKVGQVELRGSGVGGPVL